MPPSGYSQKAINGLLVFTKVNYEIIAEKYSETDISEKKFLEKTSNELKKQVSEVLNERFPKSEQLNEGIKGLTTFVTECYRDLVQEIIAGQDKYQRPVIDGKAIKKEINQIGGYMDKLAENLKKFSI